MMVSESDTHWVCRECIGHNDFEEFTVGLGGAVTCEVCTALLSRPNIACVSDGVYQQARARVDAQQTEMTRDWIESWKIIVQALKEIRVPNVDHNARAILVRLAQANILCSKVGGPPNVKAICEDVMRLRDMCKSPDDVFDVMECLPMLLVTDPEEQQAAVKAIAEITTRHGGTVIPLQDT
jgi:hypothetical protein